MRFAECVHSNVADTIKNQQGVQHRRLVPPPSPPQSHTHKSQTRRRARACAYQISRSHLSLSLALALAISASVWHIRASDQCVCLVWRCGTVSAHDGAIVAGAQCPTAQTNSTWSTTTSSAAPSQTQSHSTQRIQSIVAAAYDVGGDGGISRAATTSVAAGQAARRQQQSESAKVRITQPSTQQSTTVQHQRWRWLGSRSLCLVRARSLR